MGPPSVKPYWLKLDGDFAMPARLLVQVLALSASSWTAPEHVAAELLRAALGDQTQQASRGASVLGLVVGRQDLHLLDRVGVLHAHREAAVGTDADRRGAVDGGHELLGAPAVDRGDAGGERDRPPGSPPRLPPIVPGTSCATCVARRALSGVSAICSALHGTADHRRVRPSVVAASTWTVSASPPTSSWMSTRMLTPAFTRTPVLATGLKPDSVALTR